MKLKKGWELIMSSTSRVFKFRAWDLVYKQMIILNDIANDAGGIIVVHDILKGKNKRYAPMQFVCVRDGIEIYEGDIVNHGDTYPSVIMWNEGLESPGFGLVEYGNLSGEKGYPRTHQFFAYMNPMLVLGNIYENPELLGIRKGE